MSGIFHDPDVQEGVTNPLHGDRYVIDGVEDDLSIQVLNKILMQTMEDRNISQPIHNTSNAIQ